MEINFFTLTFSCFTTFPSFSPSSRAGVLAFHGTTRRVSIIATDVCTERGTSRRRRVDVYGQITFSYIQLLEKQAYKKLKSGDDLTASEMKVCLEVCKTYSSEDIVRKANNILDEVPFDVDE